MQVVAEKSGKAWTKRGSQRDWQIGTAHQGQPTPLSHALDESLPALAGWRQGTTPNEEL